MERLLFAFGIHRYIHIFSLRYDEYYDEVIMARCKIDAWEIPMCMYSKHELVGFINGGMNEY